jgi:type 1 glutamine amidotransferase
LLVFSRTTGYRHTSIPNGITALTAVARERDWMLTATEDPTTFTDDGLAPFDVLVFLSPSGEVLDDAQQAAFERFIRSGKGFAGIHAASTAEYDWPFYGELIGAYFEAHPETQQATIVVEDATHPATAMLPARWTRIDEWYSFRTDPRPNVHVLLTLDESSYDPLGVGMGSDHPIAWTSEYEGGRMFDTALGHTEQSYAEALFLEHVTAGIEWAARRLP